MLSFWVAERLESHLHVDQIARGLALPVPFPSVGQNERCQIL